MALDVQQSCPNLLHLGCSPQGPQLVCSSKAALGLQPGAHQELMDTDDDWSSCRAFKGSLGRGGRWPLGQTQAPGWLRSLEANLVPPRESSSPGGYHILTHLRTSGLARTQELHTPHFCPGVPNLSLSKFSGHSPRQGTVRGSGPKSLDPCIMGPGQRLNT
ncbi:hypothetical protein P7K49_010773 [Saguinus oedipus]|uniref:Uncharacterized protein n=1 Tax=Saguinus oedipus TaxID=9490 RepID=A0ABQ9VP48_SAGOE|nr:hypothetical protein P7K49_010773 [Saguinus oedipus]